MRNNRSEILNLVRRALIAQKEIGCDELLLSQEFKANGCSIGDLSSSAIPFESSPGGVTRSTTQTGLRISGDKEYESLDAHYKAICQCMKCPLGKSRNKFVYGVGNTRADLMFIGEAPGADEDRLGDPFVGRAGQLLDKILAAIDFSRDDVYIANILKCRPPGNRDPQPEEMEQCFGYLREQIRIIEPKLLCALGRVAAQALLATKTPLGRLRGGWHEYEGVPLLVTYHPAALLRFPAYKKETWEDIQRLKAEYDSLA